MPFCEKCSRLVVIGKTPDGKTIPLDPKANVYRIVEDREEKLIDRAVNYMAAHASTCPIANRSTLPQHAPREMYP